MIKILVVWFILRNIDDARRKLLYLLLDHAKTVYSSSHAL